MTFGADSSFRAGVPGQASGSTEGVHQLVSEGRHATYAHAFSPDGVWLVTE
jgi:hypothetical protein